MSDIRGNAFHNLQATMVFFQTAGACQLLVNTHKKGLMNCTEGEGESVSDKKERNLDEGHFNVYHHGTGRKLETLFGFNCTLLTAQSSHAMAILITWAGCVCDKHLNMYFSENASVAYSVRAELRC